jgi:Calcineurin-like phosphoesterase
MMQVSHPRYWRRGLVPGCVLLACLAFSPSRASAQTNPATPAEFSFLVAGDMRHFVGPAPRGERYFDGACEAMKRVGAGAFLISPGDIDPPGPVRATIDHYLGTNYLWYPVVGNHELEKRAYMAWLRHWANAGIPHLTRRGPPGAEQTIYSFDFDNSHFVVLNDYYDGHSDSHRRDDVPTAAFEWLKQDLAATDKPLKWVVAHAPLQALPDMDTGRKRHADDFGRAKKADVVPFERLLKQFHVRAYICGHTHDCSIARVNGIWQADSGHARGAGDKGAPSTFLKFRVAGTRAWVDVYRADTNGEHYRLRKTVELD